MHMQMEMLLNFYVDKVKSILVASTSHLNVYVYVHKQEKYKLLFMQKWLQCFIEYGMFLSKTIFAIDFVLIKRNINTAWKRLKFQHFMLKVLCLAHPFLLNLY